MLHLHRRSVAILCTCLGTSAFVPVQCLIFSQTIGKARNKIKTKHQEPKRKVFSFLKSKQKHEYAMKM